MFNFMSGGGSAMTKGVYVPLDNYVYMYNNICCCCCAQVFACKNSTATELLWSFTVSLLNLKNIPIPSFPVDA